MLKRTVLSCDFDDGSRLCGWTNKRTGSSWVTTNTSTPESNTGPLLGHPKGSYYAYTNTTSAHPNEEGTCSYCILLNLLLKGKCHRVLVSFQNPQNLLP